MYDANIGYPYDKLIFDKLILFQINYSVFCRQYRLIVYFMKLVHYGSTNKLKLNLSAIEETEYRLLQKL